MSRAMEQPGLGMLMGFRVNCCGQLYLGYIPASTYLIKLWFYLTVLTTTIEIRPVADVMNLWYVAGVTKTLMMPALDSDAS